MKQRTWFATITRPRRHLVATIAVWTWFVVALVGAALRPDLAPWLDGTAVAAVIIWYLTMMNAYRASRRRTSESDQGAP